MQETADKSNRLKNSLPEDNLVKQENIKIHGIGLDKAGRCTHYHTQLDIAALLCAKCRKYYACYSCHDELEDHSFVATTPEEVYPVLCGKFIYGNNTGRSLSCFMRKLRQETYTSGIQKRQLPLLPRRI